MELSGAQEIIRKLKAVKVERKLTNTQIKALVDAGGGYVSLTTIRRVFAEESEINDNFSYESTLRPIAQALLIEDTISQGDSQTRSKIEAFEAIIHQKNEKIESLQNNIDHLKVYYDKRIDFLLDQIALKDRRADEQAAKINEKDAMIRMLLEKVIK